METTNNARLQVRRVMSIWRAFARPYGTNLNGNALWGWPAYLREHLGSHS